MMPDIAKTDASRKALGFLTLRETLELGEANHILDPFSTLISRGVAMGRGNILYPGVILKASAGSRIVIGDANILYSGTLLEAAGGDVTVGSGNQFGEGGFTAKANRPGASILVGNHGRYLNNPSVFGRTVLGDGSQILGNIAVDSCNLGAGCPFSEPDPDRRGGVLKGTGTARGLHVPAGQAIAGSGAFDEADMLPQSRFHPESRPHE